MTGEIGDIILTSTPSYLSVELNNEWPVFRAVPGKNLLNPCFDKLFQTSTSLEV